MIKIQKATDMPMAIPKLEFSACDGALVPVNGKKGKKQKINLSEKVVSDCIKAILRQWTIP